MTIDVCITCVYVTIWVVTEITVSSELRLIGILKQSPWLLDR